MKSPAKPERKKAPRKPAGNNPAGSKRAKPSGAKGSKASRAPAYTLPRRLTVWLGCAVLLTALILFPVSNGFTRWLEVGTGVLGLVAFLAWVWPYRLVRWSLLAILVAVALFLIWPGRDNYDRIHLREETARAMRRFEGVRYWEGGEGGYGIDGPGLVRRGAIDASLSYGLRSLNPELVRRALKIWWSDGSPRNTHPGGRGQARRITHTKAIRNFSDIVLFPGDFALLDGREPMAYLGHHRWLWADPRQGKVVLLRGEARKPSSILTPAPAIKPAEPTPFDRPASMMRWRVLESRRREGPRAW